MGIETSFAARCFRDEAHLHECLLFSEGREDEHALHGYVWPADGEGSDGLDMERIHVARAFLKANSPLLTDHPFAAKPLGSDHSSVDVTYGQEGLVLGVKVFGAPTRFVRQVGPRASVEFLQRGWTHHEFSGRWWTGFHGPMTSVINHRSGEDRDVGVRELTGWVYEQVERGCDVRAPDAVP